MNSLAVEMISLWMALSTAGAVPLQLTQQGLLLDASGSTITGLHNLSFRVYDDISFGLHSLGRNFDCGFSKWVLFCSIGK